MQETVGADRRLPPEYTAVAVIIKGKGMAYSFEESGQKRWCWLEMVAQLDNESMAYAVKGPNGRGAGLTE